MHQITFYPNLPQRKYMVVLYSVGDVCTLTFGNLYSVDNLSTLSFTSLAAIVG